MRPFSYFFAGMVGVILVGSVSSAQDAPPSYSKDIAPFFKTYCSNCHGSKLAKSGFNFESYESLMRGSKKGKKGLIPGSPDSSLIVRTLEGKARKMPPAKNVQPAKAEVTMLRAWIAAGAKDEPAKAAPKTSLVLPSQSPRYWLALSRFSFELSQEITSLTFGLK